MTGPPPSSQGYLPPPYWLQDNPGPAQSQASTSRPTSTTIPPGSVPATTSSGGDPDQNNSNPNIPRVILYTRIANLLLSICMIIISLLAVLTTQSATTGVLACYVVVFSCLLCCFETHLKQVSKLIALNFGFMYSAKSRALFMAFVGSILFSFSLFGKIVGLAMLVNAGFNLFLVFRYPEYEAIQRKDATAEISDYLAAHPAFAKTVLDAGVSAGTEIFRKNPG